MRIGKSQIDSEISGMFGLPSNCSATGSLERDNRAVSGITRESTPLGEQDPSAALR
jgi:hypothetical protein